MPLISSPRNSYQQQLQAVEYVNFKCLWSDALTHLLIGLFCPKKNKNEQI